MACELVSASLTGMAVYALDELVPEIDPTAFVHPEAVIVGAVTVGAEASIWPAAVLRGDFGTIAIGARSSVQDGTVIHAGPGLPTTVGRGCVVGHLAHLEGCAIHDDALVGSGSVVLHHAVVERGATVGANAVVPNRMVVPAGALAVGVPAVVRPGASSLPSIELSAQQYVEKARLYRAALRRIA